jgi:hypothetical protein
MEPPGIGSFSCAIKAWKPTVLVVMIQTLTLLGHFLHSVEIQHLYALYLHNHPTGTTFFWLNLLVNAEAVRLEAAAAGNVDDTTDNDDDSACLHLPSGASYDGNKSGNGSPSSSSDGSLNGQYDAPGPHAKGGVLANLPLLCIDLLSRQQGK